jgi:hypothetical protein
MLGLALVTGTVSMAFGQDEKKEKKTEKKTKAKKAKKTTEDKK